MRIELEPMNRSGHPAYDYDFDGDGLLVTSNSDARFDAEVLEALSPLDGFSFPNGVHYHADSELLAVTNYGSNSVELLRLPEAA